MKNWFIIRMERIGLDRFMTKLELAKGFRYQGMYCGIKKKKKDLAFIVSEKPCHYAGVFTKNLVKAAPVQWNMQRLQEPTIKAVVVNSGNANACTGQRGFDDTASMAELTAKSLGCKKEEILVASTGVIGAYLPMPQIRSGIEAISLQLGQSEQDFNNCAEAILTTDTFTKTISRTIVINQQSVTITGMAKGSGMIHPNMGTMLSFIMTDALIDQPTLQELLLQSTQDSYNMISVDGDTSTNDMVLVLANGASQQLITKGEANYSLFKQAFDQVNLELAKLIIKDGEGATKFLEVTVNQVKTKEDARKMAHALITSNLVKTAFFGEDANWGRVLCALGYSQADFEVDQVDLFYISAVGKVQLLKNGMPCDFSEQQAAAILKQKEIKVLVECHQGEYSATGYGCDLSYEYVKINGEYRT